MQVFLFLYLPLFSLEMIMLIHFFHIILDLGLFLSIRTLHLIRVLVLILLLNGGNGKTIDLVIKDLGSFLALSKV